MLIGIRETTQFYINIWNLKNINMFQYIGSLAKKKESLEIIYWISLLNLNINQFKTSTKFYFYQKYQNFSQI